MSLTIKLLREETIGRKNVPPVPVSRGWGIMDKETKGSQIEAHVQTQGRKQSFSYCLPFELRNLEFLFSSP